MFHSLQHGRTRTAQSDLHLVRVAFFALLAALYVAFYVSFYWDAEGIMDVNNHALGRDFVNYWTASKLLLEGRVAEVFDVGLFQAEQDRLMGGGYPPHLWSYPPNALFIVAPLGQFPYLWAYAFWSVATFVPYLWAVCAGRWRRDTALALLLAPATFVNLFAGQNGFLTAALILGGFQCLERRPLLAGFLFGLLSFKPQLAVLVPVALVAARQWRALAAAAATAIAMIGASVAVFGVEAWRDYLTVNAPLQAALLDHGTGPFVYMMATPFMGARLLGLDAPAEYLAQAAFSLAAVVAVYWAFGSDWARWRKVAVLLVATLLAVPYAFNYDMTLLSVAAIWSYQQQHRGHPGTTAAVILALAWTLPLTVFLLDLYGLPAGPLVLAGFLWHLVRGAGGSLPQAQLRPSSS